MTSLIHNPVFREKLDQILEICKAHKCPVSIAVSDDKGKECYVAMDGNAEDVSFLAAETMFDFCKQIADSEDIPMEDLARLTYSEFTTYFNLMLQEEHRQLTLLDNPVGRA